jgi:hypothetical protein
MVGKNTGGLSYPYGVSLMSVIRHVRLHDDSLTHETFFQFNFLYPPL